MLGIEGRAWSSTYGEQWEEWEGWLAKLPIWRQYPPERFAFFFFSNFLSPDRTVDSIGGGGDARFFTTNLVKDTKIRRHWSPKSILLSSQAGWSYRCNGIRGVGDRTRIP